MTVHAAYRDGRLVLVDVEHVDHGRTSVVLLARTQGTGKNRGVIPEITLSPPGQPRAWGRTEQATAWWPVADLLGWVPLASVLACRGDELTPTTPGGHLCPPVSDGSSPS